MMCVLWRVCVEGVNPCEKATEMKTGDLGGNMATDARTWIL